jgi:hypothetical protein
VKAKDLPDITGYWDRFAQAFAAPLGGNGLLGGFVANPDVTGSYAETWIRTLARSMVTTLRISTGAIIRTSDVTKGRDLRTVPQVDLILWDPTELPALFESGDFALVHTQAARGIIEIKRTMTNFPQSVEQLRQQRSRLLTTYRRNVLGVVVASSRRNLNIPNVGPNWVAEADPAQQPPFLRLIDRRTGKPDPDGIFAFIYFLSHVARNPAGDAA